MSSEDFDRKLAAILSADVVGYSRLMAEDEEATVRTLTAYRSEIARLVKEHRGRVVDSPGDNLLAEFPSAVEAVRCASEVQRVVKSRNSGLPPDRKMEFRIGVHLGEVMVEGERIYGDGVNIAARLERLAEAGGVCISGVVHSQVWNKVELTYEDLGEQAVKNIPDPVRVYRVQLNGAKAQPARPRRPRPRRLKSALASIAAGIVLVAGGLWLSWPAPLGWALDLAGLSELPVNPPLPDKPSLVVLPFDNMSDDPEQGYFADGMTEDLTTALSNVSGLFVIARNTAFSYKGRPLKIEEVGRELGVRYVIEGSVRQAEGRVRITAQLIEAANGFHLWSQRYDRELADVFSLQAEVAEEILLALSVRIREAESHRIRRTATRNLTAYEAYVKGWSHVRLVTRRDNDAARELFQRAIELDPGFADAHAALGFTLLTASAGGWTTDPQAGLDRAEDLARQAISIDRLCALGHSVLAGVQTFRGQISEGRENAERAAELAPGDDVVRAILAGAQLRDGSVLAGLEGLRKAIRLDPNPPPSLVGFLGLLNYRAGRVAKAVELWERARAVSPDWIPPRLQLAYYYETAGQHDQARAMANEILRVNREFTLYYAEPFARYVMPDDPTPYLEALRRAGIPDTPKPTR